MPKHSISWAGISSNSFGGVIVTASESNNRPRRKIDIEKVPGRNGDIIFPQDAWENIERSYEIVAGGKTDGSAASKFRDIASWLYSPTGYQELADSSESGFYFLAYFMGGFDVENQLTRYGKADITFNCRPERFSVAGKQELHYSSAVNTATILNNPYRFEAKPTIRLVGTGGADLMITDSAGNETDINITEIPNSGAVIDCEKMNITDGFGHNINSICTITGEYGIRFPTFGPGENEVEWVGSGITDVYITPHWWTL